jgi:asparagine synthase (glutamine-hydrolysing)
MCGFAGFIQGSEDNEVLGAMLERIRRRGPDDEGRSILRQGRWRVHLGHRRLSIIDIEGGHQPLTDEDGELHVIFNGEIFNFLDLKEAGLGARHKFRTRSDTEVLANLFAEEGTDGLAKLNGMYAFAIWDADAGELTLARDPAGIKPLSYATLPGGGLAFASEMSALLAHPEIPRRLSGDGLASYFFVDYAHAPHTMLEGTRRLPPGHFVTWKDGMLSEPRPFTEFPARVAASPTAAPRDERALREELRERVEAAVRRQLISDVPVGVFLSGGIDSSIVAAVAKKLYKEPLQTFSIAFEDKSFDESAFARQVADHIGSKHHERAVTEHDLMSRIDEILDRLDEPLADPSLIPTYILSELAAKHVKVALGGDGGDEVWAGYPTYLAHKLQSALHLVPERVRTHVIAPAVSALPVRRRYQSFEWKLKRFILRWDPDPARRHLRWMSNTDIPDLREAIPAMRTLMPAFVGGFGGNDEINEMLRLDFRTYMPGSVLTKVDRASMAHGLEMRPPFLDRDFVNWSFSLPSELKLRGHVGKHLLRAAFADALPPRILRRKKKGFAIPLASWIAGPLSDRVRRTLAESPLWDGGHLDHGVFERWASAHARGREDRSRALWALLVLDHWMKKQGVS